jgi:hypothetical protein
MVPLVVEVYDFPYSAGSSAAFANSTYSHEWILKRKWW